MPLHIETGSVLRQYRIASLLGRGGMGEVYSAEDTKLGRKVAIKFLPAGLAHDAERLKRFTQEAKAASALNHPSILTIYDVDEVEGHPFLVSEFIDGQTLRERLRRGGLTLRESLDIVGQVANALAAAHATGIVHRDVKPENIMVREDGLAKLLDFGLAKVALDLSATDETVAAVGPETTPGLVMGTAQYMSPEQARGVKVDTRSDIFSLGVVLYEMAAGRPPFSGDTPSDLIAAILHYEPAPLDAAPPELERILGKTLEKDRDERYQTAKDLAVDLRRLRKHLDGSTDAARSTPGQGATAWTSTPRSGGQATAPPPVRSRTSRVVRGSVVALAAVIVIGLSAQAARVAIGRWNDGDETPKAPALAAFDDMTIEKVSGLGAVNNPAMSDDGKLLAYVMTDAGQSAIMLRQMATGSIVKIAGPTRNTVANLQFTPDGNFLYYAERTPTAPYRSALMSIPVFGGTPRQILDGRYGRPAFSPDGQQIAVVRTTDTETTLMLAKADGTGLREVGTRSAVTNYGQTAWSPSGQQIAVVINDVTESKERQPRIQIMPANAAASPRTVTPTGMSLLTLPGLSWSNDEGTLIASAVARSINAAPQLVSIRAVDGQLGRVTKDVNAYRAFSFARKSGTIAVIQAENLGLIWVGPTDRPDEAKEVPSRLGDIDGREGIVWVSDNQLAFVRVTDFPSLWTMNADGTNAKRLTEGAVDLAPGLGTDRQSLLFESDRAVAGSPEIYSVGLADGRVRQVTRENGAYSPSTSPDGRVLFFRDNDSVPAKLKKVPFDGGGASTTLVELRLDYPRVSPDGKWIASVSMETPDAPRTVIVLAVDGGASRVLATHNEPAGQVAWLPDSRGLVYWAMQGGQFNLWRVELAGAAARQLTHFSRGIVQRPAISPDGKRIAFYRGNTETDIVLLKPKGGQPGN